MKPEPLKRKRRYCNCYTTEKWAYDEYDIRMAVEWLKEQLTSYPEERKLNYKVLIEVIDEAFEDIMKKDEGLR